MSKGQRGNKEAKKPKKVHAPAPPVARSGATATPPAVTEPAAAPRSKK